MMQQMKNWLLLFMVLCYCSGEAQIQFNSFREVLDYADANAFAVRSAAINEQLAAAERKEATSYLLPSVNASLGYNDNITLQPTLVPAQFLNPEAPEGTFEELTFGTKFLYSSGLQVQWDILNFQKLAGVQTAKVKETESVVNTEVNRYKTYNQLASTYYAILSTQEAVRIYEENVEVSTAIFESTSQKFEKGIISEAELNRAEIKRLQSQRSLNLAKNNLEQYYLQLQSQLNTNDPIQITDSPDQFVLQNTAIQRVHPEVLLQEVMVQKHQSLLKQQKALHLPSVSLIYQNNNNWATNELLGFADANSLPQQSFGVQLSMSGLFSGTKKHKINQAEWKLQLQELQLENTRLIKQQEDQLLQLQLEQASDQLVENKQILALQTKNDGHAENKYQSGITSLDQRLDQYDDLLVAQDNYLQSLAAYTLAQYQIYIRQLDFQPTKFN